MVPLKLYKAAASLVAERGSDVSGLPMPWRGGAAAPIVRDQVESRQGRLHLRHLQSPGALVSTSRARAAHRCAGVAAGRGTVPGSRLRSVAGSR